MMRMTICRLSKVSFAYVIYLYKPNHITEYDEIYGTLGRTFSVAEGSSQPNEVEDLCPEGFISFCNKYLYSCSSLQILMRLLLQRMKKLHYVLFKHLPVKHDT